jgi:serine/threonine protein kinase
MVRKFVPPARLGTAIATVIGVFDELGPFRIYERLGTGGLATVDRATVDIEGIPRQLALKQLLPWWADDPVVRGEFIREATIGAQLHHPNIVRIFDLGSIDGSYYIAMELVDGVTLLELLRACRDKERPAPVGVVLSLLSELCDALDYATTATDDSGQPLCIVHRDLSPANLMVGADGHLKLIDFGIARATTGRFATSTGQVKGKAGYIAAETLANAGVDARTDLFSVGIIAWEALTARRLFASCDFAEDKLREEAANIIPPSWLNDACPPALDPIILRALAIDRDHRWESAAAMRDAIDELRWPMRGFAGPRAVAAWYDARLVDLQGRATSQATTNPRYAAWLAPA